MSNETLKLIDNQQTTIDALIPAFLDRVHRPSLYEDKEEAADYFVSDIFPKVEFENNFEIQEVWLEIRKRFLIALEN